VTGVVAAVIEAWHELRIHKLRVLLSLVGVGVAVAALTSTVAVADIGQQALVESYEREGRPAMLTTWVYDESGEGMPPTPARIRPAFDKVVDQHEIGYASIAGNAWLEAENGSWSSGTNLRVVDPAYAAMHRVVIDEGRWLDASDAENLSPAIVVDARFLAKLGLDGAPLPTTVDLHDEQAGVRATIVGVTASADRYGDEPTAYVLSAAYDHWFGATSPLQEATWEMWVPVEGSQQVASSVASAMSAELPGFQVDTSRNDYLAWGAVEELAIVKWVVVGISSVILLLGALSLLNVSVITIQQRVREIGVRRSFGATSGRVFFSVVMESIVATFVAGLVGVLVAIGLVNGPWTATYLLEGLDDVPPFPVSAAVLGLGVSLLVGALAGVLPAIIAVRVRIIDAIRF